MPIITNQRKGYMVATFPATETIAFTSFATDSNETVGGATIAEIIASVPSGVSYAVSRGSTLVFTVGDSGHYNFQEAGIKLESTASAEQDSLVVTKTGGAASSLIIKLHKRAAYNG